MKSRFSQKCAPSFSLKTLENCANEYRYGFNGMEKDDEVKGSGNSYTTEFRQYDPRLGRWLSIDPVTHHQFSPYSAYDNNPISIIDPSGADGEPLPSLEEQKKMTLEKKKAIVLAHNIDVKKQIVQIQKKYTKLSSFYSEMGREKQAKVGNLELDKAKAMLKGDFIKAAKINQEIEVNNELIKSDFNYAQIMNDKMLKETNRLVFWDLTDTYEIQEQQDIGMMQGTTNPYVMPFGDPSGGGEITPTAKEPPSGKWSPSGAWAGVDIQKPIDALDGKWWRLKSVENGDTIDKFIQDPRQIKPIGVGGKEIRVGDPAVENYNK